MTRVYRRRRAPLALAVAVVTTLACRAERPAAPDASAPNLQPRRFELAAFLASRPASTEAPAVRERLAALGSPWPGDSALATSPLASVLPTGFRTAAIAPRGDRLALLRDLDPETTEVLLHDRARAETRLLLPIERDAYFAPQRFSADGERLFYFTDEADDTPQLEILEIESGQRARRSRPGCAATRLDFSPDETTYSLTWSCRGQVEAAIFDTASGAELGPLPLPRGTRLARALPLWPSGALLYEVAGARFPRDLLFASALDPDAEAHPLTFGLSPAISADDLVDPAAVAVRLPDGGSLPAELCWPRRASGSPAALVWVEDDALPPTWYEFHPFLQFLANQGVATVRVRLRGSRGFGKSFRHAADGRLLESGFEDLEAARAELIRRGADDSRIALVAEGAWAGSLAVAAREARLAGFSGTAALGGAADPLALLDSWATLSEPTRAWWQTRLGDPVSEAVRRTRARLALPPSPGGAPLLQLGVAPEAPTSGEIDFTALWTFLAPLLGARP